MGGAGVIFVASIPVDLYSGFYRAAHQLLSGIFPDCLWQGDPGVPEVALSFDDGPDPRYTPPLLNVLAHHRVQASFFLLGNRVAASAGIVRDIYEAGHWLGLHGYDHRPFLRTAGLRESLEQSRTLVAAACALEPGQLRDVRPPYGIAAPAVLTALGRWGYRPVMWQVLSDDSQRPGVETVVRRTLAQVGNGSLIVLHDGNDGAGDDVARATDRIVAALLARGYRFVTVDRFWQGRASPGQR
ncbi:MAG: polysaccharide deacetylase family protein [Aphanocapsa lilacina HA4352-LM1]|nr:polysaccharide deacetylase family protein [Aphanocapsa lilacina HA4352-LM1]